MAYTASVLVIATVTADSDDLLAALHERAERGPIEVTLLMPATEPGQLGREAAQPRLEAALRRMTEAGLAATGVVGDQDPVDAVMETFQPGRFDEVIVSTLPGATSRWLRFDLPHRVARLTDLQVTHVIARPPGYGEPATGPAPHHDREPLGPLAVLSWAGRKS